MPSYLDENYVTIRALVTAACPEVRANGVFETDHADMIPWENMKPPYAVIAISEMNGTLDYGAVNGVYEVPVEVYYVAEIANSLLPALSPIRAALERLRDAFDAADQSKLQVLQVSRLEWGRTVDANRYFSDKNMAHRAGRLTARVLMGASLAGSGVLV